MERDQSGGSRKVTHSAALRELAVPHGFAFLTGEARGPGETAAWCCTGLGKGQCSQRVPASLTLLMQSLLVSVVQGRCFSLTPAFSDFLSGVLFLNSC